MKNNIQITLYEVFGYFLPGVMAFASIFILSWAIFWPTSVLELRTFPIELLASAALGCYFLGHAMHALGGILGQPESSAFDDPDPAPRTVIGNIVAMVKIVFGAIQKRPVWFPHDIVQSAREHASRLTGIEPAKITNPLLFGFCDETLAQEGQIGDREIYQYRAGFYKSMSMALIVSVIAVLACITHPGMSVEHKGHVFQLTLIQYVALLIALLVILISYIRKYYWFAQHRARRAVLAFIILRESARTPIDTRRS